jgi:hypothetical protein
LKTFPRYSRGDEDGGGGETPFIHAMMFRVFPINYDVKKNLHPQCRDVKVGASKNNKKDGSEEKKKEIDRVKRSRRKEKETTINAQ